MKSFFAREKWQARSVTTLESWLVLPSFSDAGSVGHVADATCIGGD
jgi:hypothetical protein